ncbi:MAG: ATPase central domain protein [Fibrobacteres bacterium]|nr:ATPase central domain protein [Fibrobacterota bacterium]
MPPPDDLILSLREALGLSPGNLALRVHLGEVLLRNGNSADAEKEFRQALSQSPSHEGAKLGLAEAFCLQGKTSAALALLEGWLAQGNPPARAWLWAARANLDDGKVSEAERCYRMAVGKDPALADPALELRLRGGAEGGNPEPALKGPARPQGGETWEIPPDLGALERPALDFSDVGGMEKLKEEIRHKIIHPLEHPEIHRAYGKKIGGGILMYGPPGCGKTYLARATAGQVKAGFMSVGIHEVLNMYLGQSERNLHDVFETARGNAPCVLFFDEVDALAANRSDMRQSAGRQLINQFLSELDGVGSDNEGVLILAATNAPWHLDAAFRRPGRFDRILFVPPPDEPAREAIFRIVLKGKPVADIDYQKLARASEGFSGADIKAAVDGAVEAKLREAIQSGKPSPLATRDLLAAAKSARYSAKEWFATARNYALYSNQGGIYDDILAYLKL